MVGLDRLELSTSPLSGVRSNHLSYRPSKPAQGGRPVQDRKVLQGRPAVAAHAAPSRSAARRANARERCKCHSRRKRNEGGRSRYGMRDGMTDYHPSCSKRTKRQRPHEEAFPLKFFLRKEVIQPQVPLRLPCYDFTPVAEPTVVTCLLAVSTMP